MPLRLHSTGKLITFDSSLLIGRGGEGSVFQSPTDAEIVAKIYHAGKGPPFRKLELMVSNPPVDPMADKNHSSIAWPTEILTPIDNHHAVAGFLMRKITRFHEIHQVYDAQDRLQHAPLFTYKHLVRTASNLASALSAIHHCAYVVGDINEQNIGVTDTALVTVFDTDSFQVADKANASVFRCHVGRPGFTAPELIRSKSFSNADRSFAQDYFGMAVLFFKLLMEGSHPFDGVYLGGGDVPQYDERVASGHFVYSAKRKVPYRISIRPPPFNMLNPDIQGLFLQCFDNGHDNPDARPDAATWERSLKGAEATLVQCKANQEHYFAGHLRTCPWCERKIIRRYDPFPSVQEVRSGRHLASSMGAQTPLAQPIHPVGTSLRAALGQIPRPSSSLPLPSNIIPQPSVVKEWSIIIGSVLGILVVLSYLVQGRGKEAQSRIVYRSTSPTSPTPFRTPTVPPSLARPYSMPVPTSQPLPSPSATVHVDNASVVSSTPVSSWTPNYTGADSFSSNQTESPKPTLLGERYPETRTRSLTVDELGSWPQDKVQYAINEVFARHGAVFPDKNVQKHFAQFAWYSPQIGTSFDQIEASLPDLERQNVQILGATRDLKRSTQSVAAGSWYGILYWKDGSISKEELVFNPTMTEVVTRASNASSISNWATYPLTKKGKNLNWQIPARDGSGRLTYFTLEPDASGQWGQMLCDIVQQRKITHRATGTFARNDVQLPPQVAPTPDPVAEQIMGGLLQGLSGALQEAARRRRP